MKRGFISMLCPCQEMPGQTVRTHRFKSLVFDQSDQKDGRCRLVRCAEKRGLRRPKGVFLPFSDVSLPHYEGSAETHTVPILQASQDNSEGLTGEGEAGPRSRGPA